FCKVFARPATRRRPLPALELAVSVLEDRIVPALHPLSDLPQLSSLPGAKATLHLDFDGNLDKTWAGFSNITTPASDIDGDPATRPLAPSWGTPSTASCKPGPTGRRRTARTSSRTTWRSFPTRTMGSASVPTTTATRRARRPT